MVWMDSRAICMYSYPRSCNMSRIIDIDIYKMTLERFRFAGSTWPLFFSGCTSFFNRHGDPEGESVTFHDAVKFTMFRL